MKVLLITNMYPSKREPAFGTFVRDQAAALRELGIAVDVVGNSDRRTGPAKLVRKYGSLHARSALRAVRGGYDLVHAHYLFPTGATGLFTARLTRSPLILTCHGSDTGVGKKFPVFLPAVIRVIDSAEKVIAVSEEGRRALIKVYGAEPGKIEVVDMGVDVKRFSTASKGRELTRRALGVDGEERLVLFAGHLIPRKSVATLIRALVRLPRRVRLLVAGDGPERAALEALARRLGVRERAVFRGTVPPDAVPRMMAAADAFCLPSMYEGRPIALLEASAAGLPVVAAPVGGVPELIEDGVNGFLFAPGDPEDLAATLNRALDAPDVVRSAARRLAAAHDLRVSARRVAEIYREAAGGG